MGNSHKKATIIKLFLSLTVVTLLIISSSFVTLGEGLKKENMGITNVFISTGTIMGGTSSTSNQNYHAFNLSYQTPKGNWFRDIVSYGENFFSAGSTLELFNSSAGTFANLGSPSGFYQGIFSGGGSFYMYGNWYTPAAGGLILSEFSPSTYLTQDLSGLFPQKWTTQGSGDILVGGSYSNGSILLLESSLSGEGSNLTLIKSGVMNIISKNPLGYLGGNLPSLIVGGNNSFLVMLDVNGTTKGEIVSSSGIIESALSSVSNITIPQGSENGLFYEGSYYILSGSALWQLNPSSLTLSMMSFPFQLEAVSSWDNHLAIIGNLNGNVTVYYVSFSTSTYTPLVVLGHYPSLNSIAGTNSSFVACGNQEPGSQYPDFIFGTNQTVGISGSVVPKSASVTLDGLPLSVSNGEFNGTTFFGINYIQASAPHFYPLSESFFVGKGVNAPVNLELKNYTTGNLSVTVSPSNSTVMINGIIENLVNGEVNLTGVPYGPYYIVVTNPYLDYASEEVNLTKPNQQVTFSLRQGTGVIGLQYPWNPIGPIGYPNPEGTGTSINYGTLQYAQNGSGHIGPAMVMDYNNTSIIYIAQGGGQGYSGPDGDGGVFKTTDGGKYWQPVNLGLPKELIGDLYMNQSNPEQLLASVWNFGIYMTNDGGGYWYKVANYTEVVEFTKIGNNLIAGSSSGIIEGSDSGHIWSLLHPTGNGVETLSVSGSTIYAMLTSRILIKSTNGGTTWENIHDFSNMAYDEWSVVASPFNPNDVYVSLGIDQGVVSNTWFSTNGGITFSPFFPVEYSKQIVFDPYNQSRVWVYGPGYFAYSLDGGKTFTQGNQVTDNMGLLLDLMDTNILIIGSDQGVYESRNGGKTWNQINGNLNDSLAYGVSVSSSENLIIVPMQDYSAFISYNGGKTWYGGNEPPIPIGGESSVAYINPYNNLFVYSISNHGGGPLAISSDGGHIFSQVNGIVGPYNYLLPNSAFYSNPYNHSEMYFATQNGIYIGKSYGSEWSIWSNSPLNSTAIVATPTSFIAGTTDGTYYYKQGFWYSSSGITGFVSSLSVDPGNPDYVVASTGYYSNGNMFLSTDGGVSFHQISLGINASFVDGYSYNPLTLNFLNTSGYPLLAATNFGIYLSTNVGQTWHSITYNLNSGEVTGIDFVGNDLYISTYGEGILEMRNFSVNELPGTIIGNVQDVSNLTVTVNGTPIRTYEGHFEDYLPPGVYYVNFTWTGGSKNYVVGLSSMNVTTLNYSEERVATVYDVAFREFGLPPGSEWSVTVNGSTENSNGSSIVFVEPNGTYSFSVSSVLGFSVSTASGSVVVRDNNISVNLTFEPSSYSVNLVESGLPSGTIWNVSAGGRIYSLMGNGTVTLPPGTDGIYVFPVATDYSIYNPSSDFYPISSSLTSSVVIPFSQTVRAIDTNLTSSMNGMFWSTQAAYNRGLVLYAGGGPLGLLNVTSNEASILQIPNYAGIADTVAPFGDGFLIGGSASPNRPGIYYYNISTHSFANYSSLLPATLNGSHAFISSIFGMNSSAFGFIGGGTDSAYFGIVDGRGFINLDPYLPSSFTPSNGFPDRYSGAYLSSYQGFVLSDGADVGIFYLQNKSFQDISPLMPIGFFVGTQGNEWSPSSDFISSNDSTAIISGTGYGGQFTVLYNPGKGIKDISSLFPSSEYMDTVSWHGRDIILSGHESTGNSSSIFIYNTSRQLPTEINTTHYGNTSLIDSATMVGNSVYFTTFNVRQVPNQSYVILSSYYGAIKLAPTGSINLKINAPSMIEINNKTYYAMNATIPEFAGNYTLTVSSPGFVSYATTIDFLPFETLYLNVTLEPRSYGITFIENGLTNGTSWSVTLNGTTESSTSDSITFQEPNGTYDFSIGNTTGYTVLLQSGVVAVNGTSVSESVIFTQTVQKGYFAGSVSPSNASIQIFINSSWVAYKENNGSFNISLNPGTYRVSVVAAGYATYSTNMTITSLNVTHLPIQGLSRSSPPPSLPAVFILVGAVVIIAVAAAIIMITVRKRKR